MASFAKCWVFVYELSGCGLESRFCNLNFKYRAVSSNELLDIQATRECRFTLIRVRDMIITYSQMYCTYKYWQHSSIIWPVLLNGRVLVYELSGCGLESRCCHLSDKRARNHWFDIPQASKIGESLILVSNKDFGNCNGKPSSPFSLISWTYCRYFHTLLIPSQELTFLKLFQLIFILSLAFSYSIVFMLLSDHMFSNNSLLA